MEQPRQCRGLTLWWCHPFYWILDLNCPFGLGCDLVIECLLGICKGMGSVSSRGGKTKKTVSHLLHFISGFRNPFSWGWGAPQTRVCILTTNIKSRQVLLHRIPVVGRQTRDPRASWLTRGWIWSDSVSERPGLKKESGEQ